MAKDCLECYRPAIIESVDGDYAVIKYTMNGRIERVRIDMLQLLDDNTKRKRTATTFTNRYNWWNKLVGRDITRFICTLYCDGWSR